MKKRCSLCRYFAKFANDIEERMALVIDPMLATGGSDDRHTGTCCVSGAVKHMSIIVLVAAPEGIKRVQDAYPDVEIYTASVDDRLDET